MLDDDKKRMGYQNGGYLQEEFVKSRDAFVKEMAEAQMKDVKNTKDRDEFIRLSKEDRNKVGKRLGIEEDLDGDIRKAVREMAENNNPLLSTRQIKNEGGLLVGNQKEIDANNDGKITGDDFKLLQKAEGGMLMDDQMAMAMTPPMESEMESDSEMENNYVQFIMGEALSEEEEDMLTSKLEQDEELSMLFDKVIDVAQEFAGSGPVEGPGSGVSDSIPARLSDGEFVFTAKAVEEIGEDTLMSMMKDAEASADERQGFAIGGMQMNAEDEIKDEESDVSDDMRKVNPRLNPNVR